MPRRPKQTIAYRVYHDSTNMISMATIDLPEIAYMTETISRSGVAGEIENPTLGMVESMSVKLTFTSVTPEIFNALDWTQSSLYECYSALQITNDATSKRISVPYRINILGRVKNFPIGTLEQGKKHGNELELEVTRLEVLLDGEEEFLFDKLNFIHKVKGTDLLATVRSQMGLNV